MNDALDSYETFLRAKGNRPGSIDDTIYKLEWFLGEPALEMRVNEVTPKWAEKRYHVFATGRAPDTHRNALSQVKTFFAWLVKRGSVTANPFAEVEGFGRRRTGKQQLRIDEARRWLDQALKEAELGNARAVAACMALLMGLRVSEILSRQVRDVDDGGQLLWIPETKTEAGRRTVAIPEALRPSLSRLTRRRRPDALLFPEINPEMVLRTVKWICATVGVPEVVTHSLRGLHSSVAVEHNVTPHIVAAALGHEHEGITLGNYVQPGTLERVRQRRALQVLDGGNRGNAIPGKRSRRSK